MVRRVAASAFMPESLVFPGGRLETQDGPIADDRSWETAALRECEEEAGFRPRGGLIWIDTWITPSAERARRYLARFFIAELATDEGHEAVADGIETEAGRWTTVAEALTSWERGRIDLPPPTACILLQLSRAGVNELTSAGIPVSAPVLPKYLECDGTDYVVMPHDPQYETLSGEGLPAPARVRELPRRFRRDAGVWKPCA
jgi:8-oxo-dGTP pyrophosphatase MutT (NUDIX family)